MIAGNPNLQKMVNRALQILSAVISLKGTTSTHLVAISIIVSANLDFDVLVYGNGPIKSTAIF